MNYLQGQAIGYDEQYERMSERDAALENFHSNWIQEITSDYRCQSFKMIDEVMDDVLDRIYCDPFKAERFGRIIFGLWCGHSTELWKELTKMVDDEIEKIVKKKFEIALTADE